MAFLDEERPPIIVKGGSLTIQSGDEKSSNRHHTKGRHWKKDGSNWKQDHDNGKDVQNYSVSFRGGGATCSPTFASEIRVTYKPKSGQKVVIVIGRAERVAGGKKEHEPLVISPVELTVDNDKERPTLTLAGEGEILAIATGSNVCTNPVGAKLQPIK